MASKFGSNLCGSISNISHIIFLIGILSFFIVPAVCHSESIFADGEDFIEEVVLENLPISTAISFASPSRAYLAVKIGEILTVDNGVVLPEPFIDISDIVNKQTDRGLLGLATDPDFPQKPYLYISYVYDPPGFAKDTADPRVIHVARLTADSSTNYKTAVPGSLLVIVGKNGTADTIPAPAPPGDPNIPERASCMTGLTMDGIPIQDCIGCDSRSHTAGTLIFGPSRQLFISLGDGADYEGSNRVGLRTQNLDSLSGRVLRIDPDSGEGLPDNPWYEPTNPKSNRSRTWSYGFRNPFRITVNPTDGQPYIGDVGTSYYEEINTGIGRNFGWPCYEGGFTDRAQQEGEATASMEQVGYRSNIRTVDFCNEMYSKGQEYVKKPLFTYRHPYDEDGKDLGASITGLAFYNGTSYKSKYYGALFIADYAQRWIRYLTFNPDGSPVAHDFATEEGTGLGAVELLQGPDQNIYGVYIDLQTRKSEVRRFRAVGTENLPPVVRASISPLTGDSPLTVRGIASSSFDPEGTPLDFEWEFGDGRSANAPDIATIYTEPGSYTVRLTVTDQSTARLSSSKSFTVLVGQNGPIASIVEPKEGDFFEIGKPVRYLGKDNNGSDVNVAFEWSFLQLHNQHFHLVSDAVGISGEFVPTEHTDDTSYRFCLHLEDQNGLTSQDCVQLKPRTARYTFNSRPAGATISYIDEELDVQAPYTANPIVGAKQTIKAAATHNNRSFLGWSDGMLSNSRTFIVEPGIRALTAVYGNLRPHGVIKRIKARGKRRIKLDASHSSDPEGGNLTYLWRFSDGKRSKGMTTMRRFRKNGNYRVVLTVRDSLGAISRVRKVITVRNDIARLSRATY